MLYTINIGDTKIIFSALTITEAIYKFETHAQKNTTSELKRSTEFPVNGGTVATYDNGKFELTEATKEQMRKEATPTLTKDNIKNIHTEISLG